MRCPAGARLTIIYCVAVFTLAITAHVDFSSQRNISWSEAKPLPSKNNSLLLRGSDSGDDDCCGIECSDKPRFAPFTDSDMVFYQSVFSCYSQFPSRTMGGRAFQMPHQNVTMRVLQCNHKVTRQVLLSILEQYDRIIFIGDSILMQQYFTFLCMLDPSLSIDQVKYLEAELECSLNQTRISFQPHGWIWNNSEPNLYFQAFPAAVRTSTEKDAIVIGAAAHYTVVRAHLMERALEFIANQSLKSRGRILYMESTPEFWPTSNGLYSHPCADLCMCESLDAARLVGRGEITSVIMGQNYTLPSGKIFEQLFPDLQWTRNLKSCIPSCLPPSWRSELAKSVFLRRLSNKVIIVPVWFQLVKLGGDLWRIHKDCTHLSLHAVITMNHQLAREMIRNNAPSTIRN